MTNEILGVSEGNPYGYDARFDEEDRRRDHHSPRGTAGTSTIQPWEPPPPWEAPPPWEENRDPRVNRPFNPGFPNDFSKSDKDFTSTLLLCFLMGGIGLHDFYAGNIGKGVAKLILLIPTFGLVPQIWAFIDLILLCTGSYADGEGKTIRI